MPVFGLPTALESSLNSLLELRPPTSWRVSGHGRQEITVVVRWTLQVSSPSSEKTLNYEDVDKVNLPHGPFRHSTVIRQGHGTEMITCSDSIYRNALPHPQQLLKVHETSVDNLEDDHQSHRSLSANVDKLSPQPVDKRSFYHLQKVSSSDNDLSNGESENNHGLQIGKGIQIGGFDKVKAKSAFRAAARSTSTHASGDAYGGINGAARFVNYPTVYKDIAEDDTFTLECNVPETNVANGNGAVATDNPQRERNTSGFYHIEARKMTTNCRGDDPVCLTPKARYATHGRSFQFGYATDSASSVAALSAPITKTLSSDNCQTSQPGSIDQTQGVAPTQDDCLGDQSTDGIHGPMLFSDDTGLPLSKRFKKVHTQIKASNIKSLPGISSTKSNHANHSDKDKELRDGIRAYLANYSSADSELQGHTDLVDNEDDEDGESDCFTKDKMSVFTKNEEQQKQSDGEIEATVLDETSGMLIPIHKSIHKSDEESENIDSSRRQNNIANKVLESSNTTQLSFQNEYVASLKRQLNKSPSVFTQVIEIDPENEIVDTNVDEGFDKAEKEDDLKMSENNKDDNTCFSEEEPEDCHLSDCNCDPLRLQNQEQTKVPNLDDDTTAVQNNLDKIISSENEYPDSNEASNKCQTEHPNLSFEDLKISTSSSLTNDDIENETFGDESKIADAVDTPESTVCLDELSDTAAEVGETDCLNEEDFNATRLQEDMEVHKVVSTGSMEVGIQEEVVENTSDLVINSKLADESERNDATRDECNDTENFERVISNEEKRTNFINVEEGMGTSEDEEVLLHPCNHNSQLVPHNDEIDSNHPQSESGQSDEINLRRPGSSEEIIVDKEKNFQYEERNGDGRAVTNESSMSPNFNSVFETVGPSEENSRVHSLEVDVVYDDKPPRLTKVSNFSPESVNTKNFQSPCAEYPPEISSSNSSWHSSKPESYTADQCKASHSLPSPNSSLPRKSKRSSKSKRRGSRSSPYVHSETFPDMSHVESKTAAQVEIYQLYSKSQSGYEDASRDCRDTSSILADQNCTSTVSVPVYKTYADAYDEQYSSSHLHNTSSAQSSSKKSHSKKKSKSLTRSERGELSATSRNLASTISKGRHRSHRKRLARENGHKSKKRKYYENAREFNDLGHQSAKRALSNRSPSSFYDYDERRYSEKWSPLRREDSGKTRNGGLITTFVSSRHRAYGDSHVAIPNPSRDSQERMLIHARESNPRVCISPNLSPSICYESERRFKHGKTLPHRSNQRESNECFNRPTSNCNDSSPSKCLESISPEGRSSPKSDSHLRQSLAMSHEKHLAQDLATNSPDTSPLGFSCESLEHLPEGGINKMDDSSSDEASIRPPTPVQ